MGGNVGRAWVVALWLALAGLFGVPKAAQAQEREARVLHILEATQEEAQRSKSFIIMLAKGSQQRYLEEFQNRARTVSKDTGSGRNGGDLGFSKPSAFVPEFAAAMLTAPLGEIVGPVKTQFGWHLLMVTEWRDASASPPAPSAPSFDPAIDRQAAITLQLRADWIYVTHDPGRFLVLRNKVTKERGDGLKSAWVLLSYSEPKTSAGITFQSSKELWWFRCADEMTFTTESVSYRGEGGSGEVVTSWSAKFDAKELRDVVPGSIGETVLRAVCGRRQGGK